MALAHVQDSARTGNSGTTAAVALSPAAGNVVVVGIICGVSVTRTYAVTDDVGGATGWARSILYNPNGQLEIWRHPNIPVGVTTVTVTQSGGSSQTFECEAVEFSGFGGSVTDDATDSFTDAADTANHTASASGKTSANALVAFVTGRLQSGAGSEVNPGSGYAEAPSGAVNTRNIHQWEIFAAGCTNEVGAFSNTGTQRTANAVIALFSGSVGRTTKNTRANPLGVEVGMGWRMEP